MERFFGLMPNDEVEIEKNYINEAGYRITIQAGVRGWTVIWDDNSSTFDDNNATTEENFTTAYDIASSKIGNLKEA